MAHLRTLLLPDSHCLQQTIFNSWCSFWHHVVSPLSRFPVIRSEYKGVFMDHEAPGYHEVVLCGMVHCGRGEKDLMQMWDLLFLESTYGVSKLNGNTYILASKVMLLNQCQFGDQRRIKLDFNPYHVMYPGLDTFHMNQEFQQDIDFLLEGPHQILSPGLQCLADTRFDHIEQSKKCLVWLKKLGQVNDIDNIIKTSNQFHADWRSTVKQYLASRPQILLDLANGGDGQDLTDESNELFETAQAMFDEFEEWQRSVSLFPL